MQVFDTGFANAVHNMAIDAELLGNIGTSQIPILHLYEWEAPCATYGHFIEPYAYLNAPNIANSAFQLARRPTGGGIIFHVGDLAFSLLIPSTHPLFSTNTLENYATVNKMIIRAIGRFIVESSQPELLVAEPGPLDEMSRHFCMAKPTRYDVTIDGKKVGGGAQRRTKDGFLHQGSIHLASPPDALLEELLLPGSRVREAMRLHSHPLLGDDADAGGIRDARGTLKNLLTSEFREGLNLKY